MQTIILIIRFSIRIQTGIDNSTNTAIQVKIFKPKQYFPYLSIFPCQNQEQTVIIFQTSSYEAAEKLRVFFEKKREDLDCHRFITNLDEDYPF